jgi:ABC-type bacteriocin/lantibiotic exporter with double-glycine peptidase domain
MAAAYKIIPGFVKIINIAGQINAFEFTIKGIGVNMASTSGPAPNRLEQIESISFRDVGFAYGAKKVLHGINLHICRGDFLGVAGPSGRGKSTIINLLLGFLTQDTGDISINGSPASQPQITHYRRHISYVKQQPFILHGPLWQNITLDDKCYDEERLRTVLEVSGLSQMVYECGEGVEKLILENGRNISGGQRQRIALARALYKEASVYILDEPFSELDEASEQRLLRRLRCLSDDGKLVVLVSHNSRGLHYCNKIFSMDDR